VKKTLPLFVIVFFTISIGVAQLDRRSHNSPVYILYGERTPEERRHGPLFSGILNRMVLGEVLPAYPEKGRKLKGTVEVEVLINEDGEVIFANPQSGPEGLWAECVKAAVATRFAPAGVEGKPIKRHGRLIYEFSDGKVAMQ
jgi:hypothetical protein